MQVERPGICVKDWPIRISSVSCVCMHNFPLNLIQCIIKLSGIVRHLKCVFLMCIDICFVGFGLGSCQIMPIAFLRSEMVYIHVFDLFSQTYN